MIIYAVAEGSVKHKHWPTILWIHSDDPQDGHHYTTGRWRGTDNAPFDATTGRVHGIIGSIVFTPDGNRVVVVGPWDKCSKNVIAYKLLSLVQQRMQPAYSNGVFIDQATAIHNLMVDLTELSIVAGPVDDFENRLPTY